MKSTQLLNALLVGALVFSPCLTLAETDAGASATTETTVSGSGATSTTSAQGVVSPRDAASGLPTGKRQYQPVIIRKEIDKASPVLGRTASGTNALPATMEKRLEERDAMREKLEERASTTRENKGERRDEMKERIKEKRGELLKRQAMMMVRIMNAAIKRESKMGDRIDSRITKMKARGADTTKSEANMVIARAKIEEASAAVKLAEDSIASAIASAETSASSTSPSDPGKAVREALNKGKEAVLAAHKALVEAIKSLKGIRIEAVATTTGATATTTTP